jgi:hypothetical protein
MKKLLNVLPHKADTKFLFKGTIYDIDSSGCLEVDDDIATELLKMAAWKEFKKRNPAGKPAAASEPEKGKTLSLITNAGEKIEKPTASVTPPVPEEKSGKAKKSKSPEKKGRDC